MKIILAILLLLVGGTIVIVRRLSSAISGQSQMLLIRSIKRNPAKASEYAPQLDLLMDKRPNITREAYDLIRSKINSTKQIGNYVIHYSVPLVDDQLLFFTEISFTDFDITPMGESADVKKTAQHNFLLRYNSAELQLELYSNMFADLNEKLQKQGFIDTLMKTQA